MTITLDSLEDHLHDLEQKSRSDYVVLSRKDLSSDTHNLHQRMLLHFSQTLKLHRKKTESIIYITTVHLKQTEKQIFDKNF